MNPSGHTTPIRACHQRELPAHPCMYRERDLFAAVPARSRRAAQRRRNQSPVSPIPTRNAEDAAQAVSEAAWSTACPRSHKARASSSHQPVSEQVCRHKRVRPPSGGHPGPLGGNDHHDASGERRPPPCHWRSVAASRSPRHSLHVDGSLPSRSAGHQAIRCTLRSPRRGPLDPFGCIPGLAELRAGQRGREDRDGNAADRSGDGLVEPLFSVPEEAPHAISRVIKGR